MKNLDLRIKDIDAKILKISKRTAAPFSPTSFFRTKKKLMFWEILVEIFSLMIVGIALGYMMDKYLNTKPFCFVCCTIASSLACINNIMKIR